MQREEALLVMKTAGLNEKHNIACARAGCHDVLEGLKSLTYHIHIHNIYDRCSASSAVGSPSSHLDRDRAIVCCRCGGRYDNNRELKMHLCRIRLSSYALKSMYRITHTFLSHLTVFLTFIEVFRRTLLKLSCVCGEYSDHDSKV